MKQFTEEELQKELDKAYEAGQQPTLNPDSGIVSVLTMKVCGLLILGGKE